MVKVFAKYGTNEKAVVVVPREYVHDAKLKLNEKFGGSWVLVDKIRPGETLLFTDNMQYRGFSTEIERYSDSIKKMD